jgi:hypothetical protein
VRSFFATVRLSRVDEGYALLSSCGSISVPATASLPVYRSTDPVYARIITFSLKVEIEQLYLSEDELLPKLVPLRRE